METVNPNAAWLEGSTPNQQPTVAALLYADLAGARVPYKKPIISQELQMQFTQKTEEHHQYERELAELSLRLKDAKDTLAQNRSQWEGAGQPTTTKIDVEEAQVRFKSAKKNLQSRRWALLGMPARRSYLRCAQTARRWIEKIQSALVRLVLACAVVFFGLFLVAGAAVSLHVSSVILVAVIGFVGGFVLVRRYCSCHR